MNTGRSRNGAWVLTILAFGSMSIAGGQGQEQRSPDSTAPDNRAEQSRPCRGRREGQCNRTSGMATSSVGRGHAGIPAGCAEAGQESFGQEERARDRSGSASARRAPTSNRTAASPGTCATADARARSFRIPPNPDIVYFLTSGGGLWRTNNWTSPNTSWTAADRRSADHGRRLGRVRAQSEHSLSRPRRSRTTRSWWAARW